ncbi:MAG: hypothetical protein JSU68_06230 [Phycisphaerales bacterium]|nr:MAG: hypothetical protein JSU68_06230 [Phycisphaerales bacterium]
MKPNPARTRSVISFCALAALLPAAAASAQSDFAGTWDLDSVDNAVGDYTFCVIGNSVVVDGTGVFSPAGTIAYAAGTVNASGVFLLTIRETNTSTGLATTRVFTGTLNTAGGGGGNAVLTPAGGPPVNTTWTATRSAAASQCTGAGAVPLSLATAPLPRAIIGANYSASLAAQGGIPPYAFTATGMPGGITFDPGTATFGGVAADGTTGSYPLTIDITDDIGTAAQGQLTLVVAVAESGTSGPTFGCCGATTALSLSGITLALFLMRCHPRRRKE